MKRMLLVATLIATGLAAPAALAQGGPAAPGTGMGPGMMGPGYGQGYGRGYGPMGPGMMGQGYGQMGPGYGGGMMGPGMMGGYGMGPGMMGGYGMGPGMMGAYGALDLSSEQRAKIAEIQSGMRQTHWALMGTMQEAQYKLAELESQGKLDDPAARQAYDAMALAHRQMFDSMLDARKRMNEVLTPRQRETLREYMHGDPRGPRGER